ncbi:MAG: C-GCAxxG-C-C family protein [Smithellaceae bacterium]
MNKSELASEYLKKGYNCAQAVIKAYAGDVGMNEEDAVKMASALGGGIGRTGHTCGAVSGAALVIGMKFGSADNTVKHSRNKAYQKAKDLLEKFTALNKSVLCKDLLGYDISSNEGLKQARESGVMVQKCPGFVSSAAKILESIINETPVSETE